MMDLIVGLMGRLALKGVSMTLVRGEEEEEEEGELPTLLVSQYIRESGKLPM